MNWEISCMDLDCSQSISQSGFSEECEPFQELTDEDMMLLSESKFDGALFDDTNKDFKVVCSENTKQGELGYQYFFHKENEMSDNWLQVFPYLNQIWEYGWSNYETNYEDLWKSIVYKILKKKINTKFIKYCK